MIKEIIVVEGKDDVSAIKRAVDAEVIATSGYHISKQTLQRIKVAYENRGIIIFTDPDFAGEQIRQRLSKLFKDSKHAFLPQDQATRKGDIGIENASPTDIIDALNKVRAEVVESREEFDKSDLIMLGLVGRENSAVLREKLGRILGIGYCNSKQFLKRLNNYGITREEFIEAIDQIKY